ncbi:class I SAM-dependent methyltransferase [Aliikangiella coralliicola]|uniref:Class I SAM-dependent methyltransferase n=1 Tax=Aliikangiella coralliicola TaxID=2592383 RepID=A0A545UB08_9GAMM|nr:methyltransferase domain-containing protein [Aliikangiella coralliicola]TQV86649.1 class I SAM-dependent methyltransferase [Aliikangiella coralliicola]
MTDNSIYDEELAKQYDGEISKNSFNRSDRRKLLKIVEHKIPTNHLIVDVGGGTGTDAIILAKKGYKVCIIEPSISMFERAHKKVKENNLTDKVELLHGDSSVINQITTQTDCPVSVISNFSSLNHLETPSQELTNISNMVSPGGYFIFSIGNPFFYGHFKMLRIFNVLINLAISGIARSQLHSTTYNYYRKNFLSSRMPNLVLKERSLSVSRLSENYQNSLIGRVSKLLLRYFPFVLPSGSAFQMYVWKRNA